MVGNPRKPRQRFKTFWEEREKKKGRYIHNFVTLQVYAIRGCFPLSSSAPKYGLSLFSPLSIYEFFFSRWCSAPRKWRSTFIHTHSYNLLLLAFSACIYSIFFFFFNETHTTRAKLFASICWQLYLRRARSGNSSLFVFYIQELNVFVYNSSQLCA